MQITETNAEGLKREFKVVVASSDIERNMQDRLTEIGRSVRLPGFRPGKVPLQVLRKRYGASVMGEVLEKAVNESSEQALRDHNLRPALQPRIEITSFKEGTDLEYNMAVELLPEIEPVDFSQIEIERLRPEIPEEEVENALQRLAEPHRKGESVDRPAEKGDIAVIDFVGSVEGNEFPGGSATDHRLEIGSGRFIPGFEDQLIAAKAGEAREIKVTFPADYGHSELAGREAVFAVTVKSIEALQSAVVDDALAKELGFDDLDGLRGAVRGQIERDYNGLARQRLKRALLDLLAEKYHFPVPTGMVDLEFDGIWKQFEEARARNAESVAEDAGKGDDELKSEYRAIAERRVRLGLLLSDIGRTNSVTVTQEEVNRALFEEARRYTGQEKKVIDFYRNNPEALANLRAPLFEDKVIDFIVEMAKVTDRPISLAELIRGEEEDEGEGSAAAESDGSGEAGAEEAAKPKRRTRKKTEA